MTTGALVLALTIIGPPNEPTTEPVRLRATPRLVCETDSLPAGGTGVIGITFSIEPRWHLYWNGQNDSGGTITYSLKTPDGFTAEDAQWPTPVRHVLPGDILDHVYEGEVTLLIPVRVPEAAAGSVANLSADLEWIVCEEECIAESSKVTLRMNVTAVGRTPKPGLDAKLFERARSRIAKPLPGEASGVRVRLEGNEAIVDAPSGTRLVFYPGPNCSPIPGLVTEGESRGPLLRMTLKASEEKTPRFEGVLEIQAGKGTSTAYYRVDVSGREKAQDRK